MTQPAPTALSRDSQLPVADRIVVFAPAGRDGPLAVDLLREAGMRADVCPAPGHLIGMLEAGVGTLLLTEEALVPSVLGPLSAWLRAQPTWCDLPVVLCIDAQRSQAESRRIVELLSGNANVVVLERPLRINTLITVAQASLQARNRQYDVRDLLGRITDVNSELRALNDELEHRVQARTRDLQARTEQVRELAVAVTSAEQRERSRIATILHDHLQQLIFGIKLKLQIARGATSDQERLDVLAQTDELADEAMETTRTLTVELDPPVLDEDDMEVIVQWLASYFDQTHDFGVDVISDGTCEVRSRELRSLLTQSVRELLFNAAKHAGVDAARVELESMDDDLLIHIVDEGRGFDPSTLDGGTTGFGLYSVRERVRLFGADLAVDAAPGDGTHITIRVPCAVATDATVSPSRKASIGFGR